MSEMSDYLEDKIVDHTLGTASYTAPTAVYLALFTAAPSDAGGGTECSYSGYARQEIAFDASSGGVAANTAEETFPAVAGADITVTHFGLFDAASGGNLLYHSAFDTSKSYSATDVISVAAGALSVTLD